jgi:hypothetical protein
MVMILFLKTLLYLYIVAETKSKFLFGRPCRVKPRICTFFQLVSWNRASR